MKNVIITIGREFGSGGHEIAKLISEKLNIKMYDKELIEQISKEHQISKTLVEYYDEKPTVKSLFNYDTQAIKIIDSKMPLEKQIYLAEKQIIEQIANQNCIIVGRCGNYIFKDNENAIRFFISSPLENRIKRKSDQLGLDYEESKRLILKTDKIRAEYYKEKAGGVWNSPSEYDFYINIQKLGIQEAANLIIGIINKFIEK